jgi:hypothetical protein
MEKYLQFWQFLRQSGSGWNHRQSEGGSENKETDVSKEVLPSPLKKRGSRKADAEPYAI